MFLFDKKAEQEQISRTTPGFEETERRTPKTGVVLLLVMFIAGIFFGWRALDDLSRIPKMPESLSGCSSMYNLGYLSKSIIQSYYEPSRLYEESHSPPYYSYGGDSSKCKFSELEKDSNVPTLFQKRIPFEKERDSINKELGSVSSSLRSIQDQIKRLTGEYGVGLQERGIGVEQPVFQIPSQQQQLINLQDQEKQLKTSKVILEELRHDIVSQITATDEELKVAYKPIFKKYNWLLRWYEFKVFLLQFLFIVPFFLLAFFLYLRLHRKNSPYTIIFTAIMAVAAILFLRVILFWFWGLFLARVIEVLIRWFNEFRILRSLVFYFGMILSFILLGGAVYWLQKKVFDPRRVTLRRFRNKQCPHCQTNLDLSVSFCPNCGAQIKEKCAKCGESRFIGLPTCPYCGDKRIENPKS